MHFTAWKLLLKKEGGDFLFLVGVSEQEVWELRWLLIETRIGEWI